MQIHNPSSIRKAVLFGVFLVLPEVSQAQSEEPPEIQIQSIDGGVSAAVTTDGDIDGDGIERTGAGRFLEGLGYEQTGFLNSEATAVATQDTNVSRFLVKGTAAVEGRAFRESDLGTEGSDLGTEGIPPSAKATAQSDLSIQFSVPVDAEYTLQGSFTATGTCCVATANVGIAGINAEGAVFIDSASYNVEDPEEERDFLITGTVGAGQTINFGVSADLYAESDETIQLEGSGSISVTFSLDFGDRDGDGLLDDWEENGIDFTGSGIRIDLPGLGADPDHKDIFVELDLMQGVPFSDQQREGLGLVAKALGTAPSFEVRNPDGQPGYNLHLVLQNNERVPYEALSGSLNQILNRLEQIKIDNFGSAEDRETPAVIEARKQIFRYALWADTITENLEPITGAGTIGNPNFVIAAGEMYDRYSLSSIGRLRDYALAGSFGHELGHSLGLDHGGQDSDNYKPHYLSIMNYAYAFPIDREMVGGGNVATTFFVDYARYDLCGFNGSSCPRLSLGEGSLLETQPIQPYGIPGIGSPLNAEAYLAGRFMWWNSASEFDAEPIRRVVSPVLGNPDWNANEMIDAETLSIDLTRISTDTPADYQVLEATTDFRYMRVPIRENPVLTAQAGDHQRRGMRFSELDTLESITTVNRIPKGDRVFKSGFEFTQGVVER